PSDRRVSLSATRSFSARTDCATSKRRFWHAASRGRCGRLSCSTAAHDFFQRFRMSQELRFRLRPLLALCLALPLLTGCDEKKEAAAPPASPAVGVRPAAMKGVSQSFAFVGHIKAVDKVDVRARVE